MLLGNLKPEPFYPMSLLELVQQNHSDESDESQSDSDNSSASSASSPSSSSSSSDAVKKLKRRAQTEKARAQKLVNAALRKQEQQHPSSEKHLASCYIPSLQPNCSLNQPGNFDRPARATRLRLLWSWFINWIKAVCNFLAAEEDNITHSINVSVIDDTSMRLAASFDESGVWRSSRTISVMNNLQSIIFGYGPQNSVRSFILHTPMIPLERTNTSGIAREFSSWVFCWLGKIGERFRRFGVENTHCSVPIQCLVVVWDSLRTNVSVMKGLRTKVYSVTKVQECQEKPSSFPLLSMQCAIHQVALCRKQLLFFFSGHWSSIVRLAHLFEVHTFRCQFRAALVRVLCRSFNFIAVSKLPADFQRWKEERNRRTGFVTRDMNYPAQRFKLHRHLSQFDNGDATANEICHWCTGCCPGASLVDQKRHCLVQLCRGYILLFGLGFPVPLTYRWLHAHKALQFCKVSWMLILICNFVSFCQRVFC